MDVIHQLFKIPTVLVPTCECMNGRVRACRNGKRQTFSLQPALCKYLNTLRLNYLNKCPALFFLSCAVAQLAP
jgi:hypothetical protein